MLRDGHVLFQPFGGAEQPLGNNAIGFVQGLFLCDDLTKAISQDKRQQTKRTIPSARRASAHKTRRSRTVFLPALRPQPFPTRRRDFPAPRSTRKKSWRSVTYAAMITTNRFKSR